MKLNLDDLDKQGWLSSTPITDAEAQLYAQQIQQYTQQIQRIENSRIVLPADGRRIIHTTLDQIESIEVWLDQKIISVYLKHIGIVSVPDNKYYRSLLQMDVD